MKKHSSAVYSVIALAAVAAYFGFVVKGGIKNVNTTEETLPYVEETEPVTLPVSIEDEAPVEEVMANEERVPEIQPETEPETVPPPVFSPTWPVSGEVAGQFSDKLVFNEATNDWRSHSGIDIKAAKTARVLAAEDGTVTLCYEDPLWGNTIELDHGEYKTVYKNLSTLMMVTVGKTVKKGDPISGVGDGAATEKALGSHLHFEIIKDEIAVDPLSYLDN